MPDETTGSFKAVTLHEGGGVKKGATATLAAVAAAVSGTGTLAVERYFGNFDLARQHEERIAEQQQCHGLLQTVQEQCSSLLRDCRVAPRRARALGSALEEAEAAVKAPRMTPEP